jgi:hypothetical protein
MEVVEREADVRLPTLRTPVESVPVDSVVKLPYAVADI